MLEAEKEWLPQFKEKKLISKPTIEIPEGTAGVDVPLDPALAIVHRFGQLIEQEKKDQ